MKKILIGMMLCTAGMVLNISANAQGGGSGFMPWTDVMMDADADGSGGVSMSEIKTYRLGSRFQGFQPWMGDHFDELDLDGDGEITMFELKKGTMGMEMEDQEVSTGFYRGFGFMPGS